MQLWSIINDISRSSMIKLICTNLRQLFLKSEYPVAIIHYS